MKQHAVGFLSGQCKDLWQDRKADRRAETWIDVMLRKGPPGTSTTVAVLHILFRSLTELERCLQSSALHYLTKTYLGWAVIDHSSKAAFCHCFSSTGLLFAWMLVGH